jgi:hypothetical protein
VRTVGFVAAQTAVHRYAGRASVRSRIAAIATPIALLGSPLSVQPALAISCGSGATGWAGMHQNVSGGARGAQAYLEYFNEALCSGSSPTFSSYWVALVGVYPPNGLGYNIYQVGVDKCKNGDCLPPSQGGGPENQPYYFYAYGREPNGPCGSAGVQPVPKLAPMGNAGPGYPPRFKVERLPDPDQPNLNRYFLYIDGALQNSRPAGNLEPCWAGGPVAAQYMNEVHNAGTQSGGIVSNHQGFTDVRYRDNSYWRVFSRTAGSECDFEDFGTQECQVHSSATDDWFSWDTRFP